MAHTTFGIDISKVVPDRAVVLTVHLRGFKWWMVRVRLAIWVIRLASVIAPNGISIDFDEVA